MVDFCLEAIESNIASEIAVTALMTQSSWYAKHDILLSAIKAGNPICRWSFTSEEASINYLPCFPCSLIQRRAVSHGIRQENQPPFFLNSSFRGLRRQIDRSPYDLQWSRMVACGRYVTWFDGFDRDFIIWKDKLCNKR